jgi:hypothetical protein
MEYDPSAQIPLARSLPEELFGSASRVLFDAWAAMAVQDVLAPDYIEILKTWERKDAS